MQAATCPDPPQEQLATTESARAKKPVSSTVEFRIDTSGVPRDVVTRVESGDEKVDWICRNAVSGWRFTPLMAGGKPVKACSSVEFNIDFH